MNTNKVSVVSVIVGTVAMVDEKGASPEYIAQWNAVLPGGKALKECGK